MPSRGLLARRLHRSVDSIDRALRELADHGIVRVEHRQAGRRTLSIRYHVRTSSPSASIPAPENHPAVHGTAGHSGSGRKVCGPPHSCGPRQFCGPPRICGAPGRRICGRLAVEHRGWPAASVVPALHDRRRPGDPITRPARRIRAVVGPNRACRNHGRGPLPARPAPGIPGPGQSRAHRRRTSPHQSDRRPPSVQHPLRPPDSVGARLSGRGQISGGDTGSVFTRRRQQAHSCACRDGGGSSAAPPAAETHNRCARPGNTP
jgi:hypothetical protein